MSNKAKRDSPLVQSVLALDEYLAELERVGNRINSTDMTSDVDVEHMQKLMTRFAECGQGVSGEVTNLSTQLNEARTRAEAVSQGVSQQAELFNKRWKEQSEKLDRLRNLGEKVREMNAGLGQLRRPHARGLTDEERAELRSNIKSYEEQLALLVDELQDLRASTRDSRMKALEKNAESLAQALQAAHKRLRDFSF
jgi:hypothetical protein